MSHRRGYDQEYKAKQLLIKKYGKGFVVKVAVSQQAPDYLCFTENDLYNIYAYEVKSTHKKKYTPNNHDKEQFKVFKEWSNSNGIPVFYWITLNKGAPFQELTLEQYEQSFMQP